MSLPVCRICDGPHPNIWSSICGGSAHEKCATEAAEWCRSQGLPPELWADALEALRAEPEPERGPEPLPRPVQGKLAL